MSEDTERKLAKNVLKVQDQAIIIYLYNRDYVSVCRKLKLSYHRPHNSFYFLFYIHKDYQIIIM